MARFCALWQLRCAKIGLYLVCFARGAIETIRRAYKRVSIKYCIKRDLLDLLCVYFYVGRYIALGCSWRQT